MILTAWDQPSSRLASSIEIWTVQYAGRATIHVVVFIVNWPRSALKRTKWKTFALRWCEYSVQLRGGCVCVCGHENAKKCVVSKTHKRHNYAQNRLCSHCVAALVGLICNEDVIDGAVCIGPGQCDRSALCGRGPLQ